MEKYQARVLQSHANGCMTSQCFVKKKFSMWKVLTPNGNILTTLRRWNLPFNSKGSSFYCSGLKGREVFPGNYSGWFPQEIFPNLLEIFPNLCQYFLTCWKYFPTFSRYSQHFWDIGNISQLVKIYPNFLEIFSDSLEIFHNLCKYFLIFLRYSQLFRDIPNLCWLKQRKAKLSGPQV